LISFIAFGVGFGRSSFGGFQAAFNYVAMLKARARIAGQPENGIRVSTACWQAVRRIATDSIFQM